MASKDGPDVRAALLETLLSKIETETYPSATMLSLIEELLTPDDVPRYAEALLSRVAEDTYPSIPMLARLKKLT